MALIEDLMNVLESIEEEWTSYEIIRLKVHTKLAVQGAITHLEKLGFIIRESESPLTENRWKISKEGKSFLRIFSRHEQILESSEINRIVMTIPNKLRKKILEEHKFIKTTKDIYEELFSEAKKSLKILCPYIDASIVTLLEKVRPEVNIKFITIKGKYSQKNPILERQKISKNVNIKYMDEYIGGIQLFQLHAKLIIVDSKMIYIGSANLKETSILHNLEAGIVSKDEEIIVGYTSIFDDVYSSF